MYTPPVGDLHASAAFWLIWCVYGAAYLLYWYAPAMYSGLVVCTCETCCDILYLLPLGADRKIFGGEVARKSVRKSSMQRLLRCYDQRFAQNSDFLFYLFNQEMRHEASREAGRIKSSANIQRLGKLINEPGFKKRLQYANDHPESDQAEEAVRFTRATTNGRVPT